jgi:type III secretion protein U
MADALAGTLRFALAGAAVAPLDPAERLRAALGLVARLTLPVAAAALAGGALSGALQTGFRAFPSLLQPRLERLDPFGGFRRLCAPAQLGRAALALAKAACLAAALAWWWRDAAWALASLPRAAGAGPLAAAAPLLAPHALRLAAVLLLVGVADLALERRRVRRALLMTRDEVRRDVREDEGDPERKAERRRVHRAVVEAGAAARATVVVVNPTRIAVALRHERGDEGAPRVVAKGTGPGAARLRSVARRAGVPIVKDVALARALHRLADVGDEIPEELYDAAAALLVHLHAAPEST